MDYQRIDRVRRECRMVKAFNILKNQMRKKTLKRRMKNIYLDIQKFNYGCGHQMMCNISSDYYNLCKRFNETADELSKIDSNCPSMRYKLS